MNQVMLVGKIKEIFDNAIIITVMRNLAENVDVVVTTDIRVMLDGVIQERTKEYCDVGDIIGIRGTLEQAEDTACIVKANKVTFLSSTKSIQDED